VGEDKTTAPRQGEGAPTFMYGVPHTLPPTPYTLFIPPLREKPFETPTRIAIFDKIFNAAKLKWWKLHNYANICN